jgi:hypothetical protein
MLHCRHALPSLSIPARRQRRAMRVLTRMNRAAADAVR